MGHGRPKRARSWKRRIEPRKAYSLWRSPLLGVHISELSNRYVKDPGDVVKAGQIVKVQVLNADPKTKRIALSMKALMPPAAPQPKPRPAPTGQLAALSTKRKVH